MCECVYVLACLFVCAHARIGTLLCVSVDECVNVSLCECEFVCVLEYASCGNLKVVKVEDFPESAHLNSQDKQVSHQRERER